MSKSFNVVQNEVNELPNNIEAEQSVIGSILVTNEIFDDVIELYVVYLKSIFQNSDKIFRKPKPYIDWLAPN